MSLRSRLGAWCYQLSVWVDPGREVTLTIAIQQTALEAMYIEGWRQAVTAMETVLSSVPNSEWRESLDVVRTAPDRVGRGDDSTGTVKSWFVPSSSGVH